GGDGPFAEKDPEACARCIVRTEPYAFAALRERRPSIDPAGSIAERLAAASVLRHPVGTPAAGAIRLQSASPLARGTLACRPAVGPDRVHEESRPAAERRGIRQVHDQAVEPSAGQPAVVG